MYYVGVEVFDSYINVSAWDNCESVQVLER